ncbi:MAG: response regulator [SAR324 cluster bacterium]|nr:response regulator [SAR324 cluster bacterium]
MSQILIIDDEVMIRDMLSNSLNRKGYSTMTAEDGAKGLEMFRQHRPYVIILDLNMPKMSGLEFLKQLDPEILTQFAIIVLTGHGGDKEIEECYRLGVQSFLRKPVNLFELKGIIKRAFDLKEASDQVVQLSSKLTSMLRNLPDLIWECDTNLVFSYVSENVKSILGYEPQELVGKSISDFLIDEDVTQFYFKIKKDVTSLNEEIRELTLRFKTKDGSILPMMISANQERDVQGNVKGMTGINRDASTMSSLEKSIENMTENMLIKINEQCQLFHADPDVLKYLPSSLNLETTPLDFISMITDPSLGALFTFAFDQQEDLPFPVDVVLKNDAGKSKIFRVKLTFNAEENCLQGQLLPSGANDQVAVMNEKMAEQEKALENAIMMDEDTRQSILSDSNNLANEILGLIKSLEPFGFEGNKLFNIEEYTLFIRGKNMADYIEKLRLLGNKVHGLKGTSGFLIPASKELCHRMEEITKPLADHKLILIRPVALLLKQFLFKIQSMLEQYGQDPQTDFDLEDWPLKIEQALETSRSFIGDQEEIFVKLLQERTSDAGEVRIRKEEYLSVSLSGYEKLSEQIKNMFYMVSANISEESLIQVSNTYNDFLDTHQRIKKVPLDMSRYERLIPSIAVQYSKLASFTYIDHGVHADKEFWNAMHEIFNHSLKNSVIHGIETVKEREQTNKPEIGNIIVEVQEDALHLYITVRDDGQGINMPKVIEKALESRIITREQLDQMTDEQILALVFIQGVSTAEKLDDNAGRGVGLNAVHEAMLKFQGTCSIQSSPGKGTSWNFIFPKSNVSIPCFVVTVGSFKLAIPEDSVEAFHGYRTENLTHLNQKLAYHYQNEAIPVLDSRSCFDQDVVIEENHLRRILILKTRFEKMGLIINDIIYHATLPLLALPEEFKPVPVYLGATLLGNDPILVFNAKSEVLNQA